MLIQNWSENNMYIKYRVSSHQASDGKDYKIVLFLILLRSEKYYRDILDNLTSLIVKILFN